MATVDVFEARDILIRRGVKLVSDTFGILGPNDNRKVDVPRVIFQTAVHDQGVQDMDGLVGGRVEVLAMVEVKEGTYDGLVVELIRELQRLFPIGEKLEDAVTIKEPLDPRPPLPARNGIYATPVYIRGHF